MINDYYLPGFQILSYTEVNDGGIAIKTHSVIMEIAGRMRPLSGNEMVTNEKLGYKSSHRFYCDIAEINNTHILRDPDGRIYDIKYVKNPMEMNHHLEIDCNYNPDISFLLEESS